jgi:hypothetical protein
MKKAVYKLHFDCGRMGELTGLFVERIDFVNKLIESKIEVYFGEALGKHSEIFGPIENQDITMVSDGEDVVNVILDNNLQNGENPFENTSINFDFDKLKIKDGEDFYFDDATVYEIIEKMMEDK